VPQPHDDGVGRLIDGKWAKEGYQADDKGRFVRDETTFHDFVTADGSSGFAAEAGRYHLYVSYACPWASRTVLVRKLRRLEDVISMSVVDPFMGGDGWQFSDAPGTVPDIVNGARFLREIYVKAKPDYTGRVTVPVLWDKQAGSIVNNDSREIVRMLNREFAAFGDRAVSFCPPELEADIDREISALYRPVNNGVYRAGFARTQEAYDEAVTELFEALDSYEQRLATSRYLLGSRITEPDWCFFTTLVRFDVVYHYHFKCNVRKISDYRNLSGYLRDLYQVPGVSDTVRFDHIKQHYYRSHDSINPRRIVPKGPLLDFEQPHGREHLPAS
jgi:putative glutathione S-transferase